ncbi:uncharacterized protein [Ptychodera flava]|uniref:uncharacterized protein isoform X2 n=1 Tax=Ptychodera flava TaxID=63121 RepID=UPI00396A7388
MESTHETSPTDSTDSSVITKSQARRGRQRGRGSGRGRGQGRRGRGRGRGASRGGRLGTRADEALRDVQQRKNILRMLQKMTPEQMHDLLLQVVERDISLIFDLAVPSEQAGGYHPGPSQSSQDWCVCQNCRQMPTLAERKCCGKMPEFCISRLPDFRVICLDEGVLAVARAYRMDMMATNDFDDYHKCNWHAAYQQFILWQHGKLGAGNRRVIPGCCVWAIRDKYPDQFGQYTGFIPTRFA